MGENNPLLLKLPVDLLDVHGLGYRVFHYISVLLQYRPAWEGFLLISVTLPLTVTTVQRKSIYKLQGYTSWLENWGKHLQFKNTLSTFTFTFLQAHCIPWVFEMHTERVACSTGSHGVNLLAFHVTLLHWPHPFVNWTLHGEISDEGSNISVWPPMYALEK